MDVPSAPVHLDAEAVRFRLERDLTEAIRFAHGVETLCHDIVPKDSSIIRRRLLAGAVRLTPTMAPTAYVQAGTAAKALGVVRELEVYQSGGRENAALHFSESPVVLEIQGRLLTLVDDGSGVALFGHELGHYLAHGPWTEVGSRQVVAIILAERGLLDAGQVELVRRLVVAREITADRFGLLACRDLDAALRLEMIATTGLSGESLTWDTGAYLEQSRELMEAVLAEGGQAFASSHPEHSLRAWATWLFSETETFRRLTGQGSGTRRIEDVDALIAAALGSVTPSPDLDLRAEPPSFLSECALAAAVLVASADGEIAAEELDAIEDAFSRAVPGWSEVLDPEIALERFYETAMLLRAAGLDLVRRLFLLLAHVMGADDVVDAREVQMVLAIGEALGFGAEFRQWLRAAIDAMRSTLEVDLDQTVAIPLPPRRSEVKAAIASLCDSIDRVGQAVITPRRVLRIAGSAQEDTRARERVAALFEGRGIASDPELRQAKLDDPVRFIASQRRSVANTQAQPDVSRSGLLSAITRLREELVSGDGRSPSVRLRRIAKGRHFDLAKLEGFRVGASERALAHIQNAKPTELVTAEDAGRHDAAWACAEDLRLLDRAQRDRREETGANDLYLGYPMLYGSVSPPGQERGGYLVRAPLVLYPVELERDGRGTRSFRLRPRSGEEPCVNQSLLRLVFHKADLAMPDELCRALDELAADPARSLDDLIQMLTGVGVPIARRSGALAPFVPREDEEGGRALVVEECAVLGLFPQSNSDLLGDYSDLLRAVMDPKTSIAERLSSASALLPATLAAFESADHEPSARGTFDRPVVLADPSQREVAAECRRNRVTVVDGPPGTGKSQLIVNLVADALRRGERVAVVAEKRAALDVVYQRLHGCGLGAGVGLVHDVHDDRKSLFTQIRERLEQVEPSEVSTARLDAVRREYDDAARTLRERAERLEHRPEGASMTVGQLMTAIAAGDAPIEAPSLVMLNREGLERLLELSDRLWPLRELWGPSSWWRTRGSGDRASLERLDDTQLARIQSDLATATQLEAQYRATLQQAPVDEAALEGARERLEVIRAAGTQGTTPLLLHAFITRGDSGVSVLRDEWSAASQALAKWPRPPEVMVDPSLTAAVLVLTSHAGQWSRFFSPLWWKTRARVRRDLPTVWPERAAARFDPRFLEELYQRLQAARVWAQVREVFARLGVPELAPKDTATAQTELARLPQLAACADKLRISSASIEAIGLSLPERAEDCPAFAAHIALRTEQLAARDRLRSHATDLYRLFPWLQSAPAEAFVAVGESLRRDGHALREIDGWLALADELTPSARRVLDALATSAPHASVGECREALARIWSHAHLTAVQQRWPDVEELGSALADQRIARAVETMQRCEPKLRELEVEVIKASIEQAELLKTRASEYRARRTPAQKVREAILKETSKKSRLMPLRRFIREFAPAGVLDVLPCWLLSPETMVVLFPGEPLFDLIIFDEASQCTVEAGLPVMLRAKRVVIAGDEKQMPPTSFFKMGGDTTDDEDRSEDELQARDAFSAESLLALARSRCAHAGLTWHYRCRQEELIAFSNHSMYDGELLSVPSTRGPEAPSALKWIHVEDGCYDAGLNKPEAERIVTLLRELLTREPRPSVGIVTFNLAQRRTILDAIDARVAADAEFAELWISANAVETLDERPFVKNLESVQGDERDVIVFSLGHAPIERRRKGGDIERYVPARFGPLGQRGGERRLNVAISRAKAECYVVASFDPSLLHVGSSLHAGPRLFKGFLDFAHALSKGRTVQAKRILDDVRGTARALGHRRSSVLLEGYLPLAAQIALALESSGLRCELELGVSSFRIPLAVGRVDEVDFRLAVLTDEGEHAVSPFERYVHQSNVLGLRGWDLLHVTAATWLRRRSEVLAEIHRRVGVPGALGTAPSTPRS